MELGDPGRRAQRRIWIIYPFEKRKEVFLLKKSWRNFSKRGLSLLVCLVMCLSMLPGVAWAEEDCSHVWIDVCRKPSNSIRCDVLHTHEKVCSICGESGESLVTECDHSVAYRQNGGLNLYHTAYCTKCIYAETTRSHKWIEATCSTARTCSKCYYSEAEIVPDAHNWGDWQNNGNDTHTRTCTYNSEHTESGDCFYVDGKCTGCGALQEVCSHTCKDNGILCNVCGREPDIEHTPVPDDTTTSPGTCTVPGKEADTICGVCGQLLKTGVDIFVPHTPKSVDKAPTCTENGVSDASECEVCGIIIEEGTLVYAVGHKPGDTWTSDAINHWYVCTVCGEKQDEEAHTYGEPAYVYISEKFNMGTLSEVHVCTICGYEKREQVATGVKETKSAATCTDPGKTVYSWGNKLVPGGSVTVIHPNEPALGHLPPSEKWNQYGASYGYSGEHVKLCGRRNPNTNRNCNKVVAHAPHDYLPEETFKYPTCTAVGYTWNLCKDCGWNKGGKEISALGHKYDEPPTWTWIITAPSATAAFKCTRSGCTHVETVTAAVDSETTPANCVTEGKIDYTATAILDNQPYTATKTVPIPATGIHDYDDDGVCKVCGHVNPADHKHVYDMEKGTEKSKATCTAGGLTSYPCKYCDATLDVVSNPLGHEYSVTTKPATCVDLGVETHTCKHCNDSYTSSLPLVPHTLTVHAEKKPACTENGMKAHSICSVCNGFFTGAGTSLKETTEEALTILAIGHAYGAWTITAAPTMSAPGAARRVCANDASHVETVELPQLSAPGTPDSVWTLDTERSAAPTCTESGENMYVSVYGEVRANVPALGHSFSDTWTYDGASHWHACARCGIAGGAAAHAYDGGVVTLAPTADTAGVRTYTCTACGRYYTEAIPATGTTGPVFPAPDPGTPGGGTNNPPPAETIIDEDTPLADITFDDVMPTDPFYEAVQYVFNRKLMNGVSDTSFDPYGTLTRAMVVTILYRLEGEPAAEPSAFLDVAAGQWYTDAVGWGAANKVVKGYSEDRFGPMDPVTREQLAAILHRYAQYKGYDVTEIADLAAYADMASISEYALEAMAWAVALGAPEALSETALAPRDNATRAQVAVAFMNFCEKYIPLETEGEAA